jgi:hypothetical protein
MLSEQRRFGLYLLAALAESKTIQSAVWPAPFREFSLAHEYGTENPVPIHGRPLVLFEGSFSRLCGVRSASYSCTVLFKLQA